MSTEVKILRQSVSFPEDNEGRLVVKEVQICDNITDKEVIENLIEACRKNWHLEGECGFIGECDGAELAEIIGRGLDGYDSKIKHDEILNSDEYRIEISW